MTPQGKNLIAVLVVSVFAAGLGLFAYFGVSQPEQAKQERQADEERILNFKPTHTAMDGGVADEPSIEKLAVTAKGESTSLEKQGNIWVLTSPVHVPADDEAVKGLLGELQASRFKYTVEENPSDADLEKYGLREPKQVVKVTARISDGKGGRGMRELTLFGGVENPFDGSVYLKREGDKRVYAAPGSLRVAMDKNTYDLRDKTLLAVDQANLKSLEVKTPKNHYTLTKDAKGAWQIAEPNYPADAQMVSEMLSALKLERALAFFDDSAKNRKELGFTAPQVKAIFTPVQGAPIRLQLTKVVSNKTERAYALKENGSSILAEVPLGALSDLDKPLVDLKDKTVLSFKKDEVASLRFYPGNGKPEFSVEKSMADAGAEDDWRMGASPKGAVKRWKIPSLLSTLSSLKATALGPERPKDWSKYGMDNKSPRVEMKDNRGQLLTQLWIGKAVPGKDHLLYVRGTRPLVMEIEASRLADLPKSPFDLLEPTSGAPSDAGVSPAAVLAH